MKNEPDALLHFFISSIEVMVAYIINYFLFFKYRILGVINQMNYYEDSIYVVVYMAITYISLGLIYVIWIKYKDTKVKPKENLIYSAMIILILLGVMGLIVANILTEEYGSQHFISNYLLYVIGSAAILYIISLLHKYIVSIVKFGKIIDEKP